MKLKFAIASLAITTLSAAAGATITYGPPNVTAQPSGAPTIQGNGWSISTSAIDEENAGGQVTASGSADGSGMTVNSHVYAYDGLQIYGGSAAFHFSQAFDVDDATIFSVAGPWSYGLLLGSGQNDMLVRLTDASGTLFQFSDDGSAGSMGFAWGDLQGVGVLQPGHYLLSIDISKASNAFGVSGAIGASVNLQLSLVETVPAPVSIIPAFFALAIRRRR